MSLQANGGAWLQGNLSADTINSVELYLALVTQTSTNAPTSTVIKNDLSGTPAWAYSSTGIYTLTLTGAWRANRTSVLITPNQLSFVCAALTDANVITIKTYNNSGTLTDALLSSAYLEIRVIRADR